MRIFNLTFLIVATFLAGCDAGDSRPSPPQGAPKGVKVDQLKIDEGTISSLERFRAKKKFTENTGAFYPGAPDEETRLAVELIINDLASRLISGLRENPTKKYVLGEFEVTLLQLEPYDSEEADRSLLYLEEIMDVVGIRSSYGLLNKWRYGFDPS